MAKALNRNQLIRVISDICYFAQSHSQDWSPVIRETDLPFAMEHVSYIVSCFLAQNTPGGYSGVDWDIVHDVLCGPVYSHLQWQARIEILVDEFMKVDNDSGTERKARRVTGRRARSGARRPAAARRAAKSDDGV